MKIVKTEWPIWAVLIVPFILIATYWNQFPEQIPVHFNFEGEPNGYQSKAIGLFLLPVINIAVYFSLIFLPRIDPSGKNYSLFNDKFKILRLAIHVFLMLLFFVISFYAMGYNINIAKVIPYGIMALFLVFGNYMGNIRHNYFIGIRTPWTLADENIWTKTHRLAAKVWVTGTLAMIALFTVLPHLPWLFFIYIGTITFIPIIYSYVLFRQKPNQSHE